MRRFFHKRTGAVLILPTAAALILLGVRALYTRPGDPSPKPRPPTPDAVAQDVSGLMPNRTENRIRSIPYSNTASVPATQNISADEPADLDEAIILTQEMNRFLDDGDELNALIAARVFLMHPNREVRVAVLHAMEWIGLPAAMDMAQLTDDPDEEIRQTAQASFWKMIGQTENDALRKNLLSIALQSPDTAMRNSALTELIHLPDALSFELIASAMDDPEKPIAALANENLEFISGQAFESRTEAMIWFEKNKQNMNP